MMADEDKPLEAGWLTLRARSIPPDAPPHQLRDMRIVFMAGAHHLFCTAMMISGDEPTPAELRRLALVDAELRAFVEEMNLLASDPAGTA